MSYASSNYHNCTSPRACEFARKWALTESQVRRAFHPSEWHHCNFKYGDAARAYFFAYSRNALAEILKQARRGEFEDLHYHHSHISGGKQGQEKYLLKVWRKAMPIRISRETVKERYPEKITKEELEKKRRDAIRRKRAALRNFEDELLTIKKRCRQKLRKAQKKVQRELQAQRKAERRRKDIQILLQEDYAIYGAYSKSWKSHVYAARFGETEIVRVKVKNSNHAIAIERVENLLAKHIKWVKKVSARFAE